MRKYLFVLLGFAAITLVGSPALAQIGPDVIVGDLQQVTSYGSTGDIYAYAVGTVSCNVGDETLNWFSRHCHLERIELNAAAKARRVPLAQF